MMKNSQIFTIPNILSAIRILMIPFIVWAYLIENVNLSALLIIVSGLTDIVDGFIARRFNMISPLGKALDPIADKLTIGVVLLSLCFNNRIIVCLLIILVIKEVLMGVEGLLIIKHTGTTYSARWYGKISTIFLYGTILTIILWENIPKFALFVLLYCCIIILLFAFTMYTMTNIKVIKKTKNISEKAQQTN